MTSESYTLVENTLLNDITNRPSTFRFNFSEKKKAVAELINDCTIIVEN